MGHVKTNRLLTSLTLALMEIQSNTLEDKDLAGLVVDKIKIL